MNLDFAEFLKHVNPEDYDHYQRGKSPEHNDKLVICGPLSPEVETLYNIAKNNCPEKSNILEIGNWLGLSTITFALALKEKYHFQSFVHPKIYTIDPHDKQHSIISDGLENWFKDCPFDISKKFQENIKKWEVEDYIEYHRCFSDEFDKEIKNIGLLFIDGDHRSEQVKKDLNKFVPMLMKEGILVMHDRNLVIELFNEYNRENENLLSVADDEINHLERLIIARKI